jgi:hypothetical protein
MGILDEAIRQHLDLKRRQGADQDELQRLEDEAFGPPSRPGDPDFPQREDQGEAATGEQELAEATEPAPADEAPSEPGAPAAEPPSAEIAQPATEESEQPAFFDAEGDSGSKTAAGEDVDLELDVDEEIGELEEEQPGASGEDAPISSLDTVEHHFEEAMDEPEVVEDEESPPAESEANRPEDSAEDAEDVLEETPEFLQDTPEDDELWFEQGEPKDFDF